MTHQQRHLKTSRESRTLVLCILVALILFNKVASTAAQQSSPLPASQTTRGSVSANPRTGVVFYYNFQNQLDGTGGLKALFARAPLESVTSSTSSLRSSTASRPSSVRSSAPSYPTHTNVRQSLSRNLYISLTTCSNPNVTNSTWPQLMVYLSDKAAVPGPNDYVQKHLLDEGFVSTSWNIPDSSQGGLYIGIYSQTSGGANGTYTFEIGASTHEYLHNYTDTITGIYLDDTDFRSVLVTTYDAVASDQSSPNYTGYIFPTGSLKGLSKSACALKTFHDNHPLNTTITYSDTTTRGPTDGKVPPLDGKRRSIFFSQLNSGTPYDTFLVLTDGRVQTVWKNLTVKTKISNNCRILYNLTFCDRVAYAVPANPTMSDSDVIQYYDQNITNSSYQNFQNILRQFDCTTNTLYSPVRNCTDCERDYKNWLCAVSIPRCADVLSNDSGIIRPINQSRTPDIDISVSPGEHKEILPCIDLCYTAVQSCPPFLSFTCPKENTQGLSYGDRNNRGQVSNETAVSCNSLSVVQNSAASGKIFWDSIMPLGGFVVICGVVGILTMSW